MSKFERILHLSKLTQEDRWQSEEPDEFNADPLRNEWGRPIQRAEPVSDPEPKVHESTSSWALEKCEEKV